MHRLPPKRNYTKLTYQAQKSKRKVSQNQIAAFQKWQKKLGRKSARLDKLDDKLRKLHTDLKDQEKRREDKRKALESLLDMVNDAHKELKTYKSVPVDAPFPPAPPKNVTGVGSLVVVVGAMIVYLAAVKSYMAMAEALSKKDD